jgi:ABC-type glycerol-3-phosphate transport system substrate-binding protein
MNDLAEYHPLAAGLGMIDGHLYYIPRKLETRILFYRKSMVADAFSKYESYQKKIDEELKKYNDYGLPAEYVFEADPNQWDFYDLFVVGYIWSHETYTDATMGRLAHRGARYGGTSLFLMDRALQLGATHEDLLKLTADKVADMFVWERALIRSGTYNPGMWQDPWKGSNLYNGIKDGKIFSCYLQQIDCFNVHGWEDDPGMPTYMTDIDDMGLSVVPKAVSFELDKKGKCRYEGTRSISIGGWWWGIPQTCPDAKLAYELARYITNKENQANECSKFGMLPVRKDILGNLPEVFDQGWVGEIFKVSVEQIRGQLDQDKLVTVPLVQQYAQIGQNYVEAWYKLCVEYDDTEEGLMNFSTMKMRLASDFQAKQDEILGGNVPE